MGLMIHFSALLCLHIDWGFVRLNVTSADQFSPHCSTHWDQQLADFEDPAVQRRAADFQAEVPFPESRSADAGACDCNICRRPSR